MKTFKKAYILVACILCFWVASAQAELLKLGGSFTQPIYLLENGVPMKPDGGGSIDPSYLDGKLLAYLYCVEPYTLVYASSDYNNTMVTTDGKIHGAPIQAAGQIAWLLSHYGTGGQGEQAYALQAAIWHLVEPKLTIDPGRSTLNEVNLYTNYLTALGDETGNVNNFIWLSPGVSGSNTIYQGLVGPGSHTPIPAAVWLFGSGLIGLVGLRRKFTK